MTRRAACTHSRLERSEPRGASSTPTRTCPPRAIAARQRLHGGKARRGGHVAGKGNRGIYDAVDLAADALDDALVDLRFFALAAARLVVRVDVNDGGALASAGDALCDDFRDAHRNARLKRLPPSPVQRYFQPRLHVRPIIESVRCQPAARPSLGVIRPRKSSWLRAIMACRSRHCATTSRQPDCTTC